MLLRFSRYVICVVFALTLCSQKMSAQRFAVSTDLVQWALVSPNATLEMTMAQHHAFAISASVAPWMPSEKFSISHLTFAPEYKYWFEMPYYGHYSGCNLLYSAYAFSGTKSKYRRGSLVAACANYGYSVLLSKRWNFVPFVGLGVGMNFGETNSVVPVARIGLNFQLVVK